MGEREAEAYKEHYNLFIDYIKKTDMMQGNYYLNMYNTFNDCQYSFTEFSDLKVTTDTSHQDSKAASKGPGAAATSQKANASASKDGTQIETGQTPAASQAGPRCIFGPIDEIRRSIQRYRDKFVFNYDKSLSEQQRLDYEEFMAE